MKAPTDRPGRMRLLELCAAWYAKASPRDRAEILRLARAKGGLWGDQTTPTGKEPPRSR